jgi:hypothetical protein
MRALALILLATLGTQEPPKSRVILHEDEWAGVIAYTYPVDVAAWRDAQGGISAGLFVDVHVVDVEYEEAPDAFYRVGLSIHCANIQAATVDSVYHVDAAGRPGNPVADLENKRNWIKGLDVIGSAYSLICTDQPYDTADSSSLPVLRSEWRDYVLDYGW